MAIDRPKAIDDAPACGPQQSEGRQKGEFLVSRGMGAAQGRKSPGRRCGIGDRGAAGLRPDQAIEEAVWERCDQTATKQESWRPVVDWKEFGAPGETAPSSCRFRPVLPNQHRGRRETPRKTTAIHWPRAAGAACSQPERRPHPSLGVARTIRQHPIMDLIRDDGRRSRSSAHDRSKPCGEWASPVRCPAPANREPAGWPVEKVTPMMIAATIEKEQDADDDQDRDGDRCGATGLREEASNALASQKNGATWRTAEKNGRRRKSVRTSAVGRACSKPVQRQGSNS